MYKSCGNCRHEQICAIRMDTEKSLMNFSMIFHSRSNLLDALSAVEHALGEHCDHYLQFVPGENNE